MNTIRPSAQRVHPMSNSKDAVTSATPEKIAKRPANFVVRHDSKQRSSESNQPSSHTMSSIDSAALHASLNQSRQTWTHAAFGRFIPGSDSNDRGQQQQQLQQQHASASSGLSLAGVCTVRIGPHMFLDTKFYTVLNAPAPPLYPDAAGRNSMDDNNNHRQGATGAGLKKEPEQEHGQAREQESSRVAKPRHQVVMEFKENPGALWLFPAEAALEFTPANDHEAAQISASFSLPLPKSSESKERVAEPTYQATTVAILHATTALREGLELAVKGPHTTNKRPKALAPRQQTLSTYSEDPSEILGSGKQSSANNNSSSTSSAKRKMDTAIDNQKPTKQKRAKEHDDKASGSPNKKAAGGGGTKKNGVSVSPSGSASSSNSTQHKRCAYCDCATTPMWRRGPGGPSTLCNACGVKWKHGKILQDASDTHQTSKTGAASSTSPTASASSSGALTGNHRPSNSKAAKALAVAAAAAAAAENGLARHAEDKKSPSKVINKKVPQEHSQGNSESKTSSKDIQNGSRTLEAERIVPVKKRHSSKAAPPGSPPGPRMVPIHELGDPTKTPSKFSQSPRKHGHGDGPSQLTNGRSEQKKNGFSHHDYGTDAVPSSTSIISMQSDMVDSRMDLDSRGVDQPVVETLSSSSPVDDGLSLYTKNLYTNNTATFPLHFPTISIGFGPNNAYYTYPNCAVVLYENHFQIKLIQAGERTEIDVWKEGIEGTEFQVVDVGDGESMIVMKALLRQYLTRFDKELLNPDRNESLIVFRFRERLDGGGPSVKPLLEHWLATDIPVPPAPSSD